MPVPDPGEVGDWELGRAGFRRRQATDGADAWSQYGREQVRLLEAAGAVPGR